jgi:hypothetical protein
MGTNRTDWYSQYSPVSKYEAWLLNNETRSNSILVMALYLHVTPFEVISVWSYTPLHTSFPALEASPWSDFVTML